MRVNTGSHATLDSTLVLSAKSPLHRDFPSARASRLPSPGRPLEHVSGGEANRRGRCWIVPQKPVVIRLGCNEYGSPVNIPNAPDNSFTGESPHDSPVAAHPPLLSRRVP